LQQSVPKGAFIGLGQMGFPMARRLVNAGFDVTGYDGADPARQKFADHGGKVATSLAKAVEGAGFIITMLPNGQIVQSALFTDPANLTGILPGALLIEMSSSAPSETRELAERLPPSIRLIDAPVSGGVKRAVEGTLAIMAGGDDTDIDAASPLLLHMAARIFRCGPVGAGHAVKAINNFVSGAGVIAAVEAIRLADAFGVDTTTVTDVLNASSGKSNTTEMKMKQYMLSGTFDSGFAMGLMAKDIRTAATLSNDLGMDQPFLKHTVEVWEAAADSLGGSVDHTRLFEYLHGDKGAVSHVANKDDVEKK